VYLLEVTPAALKGLNQYQKELAHRGIAPEIVRTRVSFDTDASFPKLKFGFGGFNDAEAQEAVDPLFGSAQIKEITGETLRQPVAVPQVAAPVAAPVAPKPVVKVAEPEPAPTPAEPPAAKRGFGATKQAAPVKAATPVKAAAPAAAAAPMAAAALADSIAALVGEVNSDDA
jgi:hypothetical protein